MDVRLPISTAGICFALLLGGCSPGDEKPAVSLEEKTAQFEQSLPFDLTGQGRVIISSVYKPDTNPAKVTWQCNGGGAYTSGTSLRLTAG